MQQFIPFIKFFNLNPKESLNKVYSYRKVLPKELRENLIKHFIDHDFKRQNDKVGPKITEEVSSKGIDSRIITSQHAELISKWIDRLEIIER